MNVLCGFGSAGVPALGSVLGVFECPETRPDNWLKGEEWFVTSDYVLRIIGRGRGFRSGGSDPHKNLVQGRSAPGSSVAGPHLGAEALRVGEPHRKS
jgi:hypothetical protein